MLGLSYFVLNFILIEIIVFISIFKSYQNKECNSYKYKYYTDPRQCLQILHSDWELYYSMYIYKKN